MDWTTILQAGQAQDQQGQIDQQLADLLMRRKNYQALAPQHTTGLGALLGGIGDYRNKQAFNDQETALRQQRQDLSGQLGTYRSGLLGELIQAQQPTPTPPEMLTRPGYDRNVDEQARQQRLSQIQIAALLSGDPHMAQAGQALQHQQEIAPHLALQRQQLAQGGPQEALGGQTPSTFELLTKRGAVSKYIPVAPGSEMRSSQTGLPPPGSSGTSGLDSLISPEAIDQHAQAYLQGRPLPNFGRANPIVHGAIIKRAAELNPSANLALGAASTKADTGSLASQQKILDNAEGWERTGKANLDVLMGVAQKLKDTGSPFFNRPVRYFMDKGIGDPNQAAFRAAHATVVNEYAKILSGAAGSSSVTDSARREAESMLPLDATWDQLGAAAKVLDTDAGNRINSARQQIANIKGRIGGQPTPASAATAAPAARSSTGSRPRRTVNGETREWDGQKWVPIGG